MEISRRHHYLPEFLIKGFTGKDGKVSVYDKEKKKLDRSRKSAKQIFFEWNRNTFLINGSETDFLEKIYQFGESKFAPTYFKITENLEPIKIEAYDVLQLVLFISDIYWRVPSRDVFFQDFIKNLELKELPIKIKNKITGEDIPVEELKPILEEPGFIESLKKLKAIQDYTSNVKNIQIKNWLIYYRPKEAPQLQLLCDNPLIIKENLEKNILNSELIFPLSKGKTVYHTKGKRIKEIPATNKISIDILLFLQAEKYVCCADSSYLQSIIELSKLYNSKDRISILKQEIFGEFQ